MSTKKTIPVMVHLSEELVGKLKHVAAVNDDTAPNMSAAIRWVLKLGLDKWDELQDDET